MASKPRKARKVRVTQKSHVKNKRATLSPRRKLTIANAPATTKLAALIGLLSTPGGATLSQMMSLTGWQEHSLRGFMSGTIKKKLGYSITSKKPGDERVYRIGGKS